MHLAWVSSQQGYQASQVIQVFPQDLGERQPQSQTPSTPAFLQHQRSGPWSAAPSYLGIVCFLFLLEENVKLWLVYLDTREAERSGECGGRRGQVWGYGDGPGRETQVMDCRGQEEEWESQKRERLGLRDQHANVQRRYFNQLGGVQQERCIVTHIL